MQNQVLFILILALTLTACGEGKSNAKAPTTANADLIAKYGQPPLLTEIQSAVLVVLKATSAADSYFDTFSQLKMDQLASFRARQESAKEQLRLRITEDFVKYELLSALQNHLKTRKKTDLSEITKKRLADTKKPIVFDDSTTIDPTGVADILNMDGYLPLLTVQKKNLGLQTLLTRLAVDKALTLVPKNEPETRQETQPVQVQLQRDLDDLDLYLVTTPNEQSQTRNLGTHRLDNHASTITPCPANMSNCPLQDFHALKLVLNTQDKIYSVQLFKSEPQKSSASASPLEITPDLELFPAKPAENPPSEEDKKSDGKPRLNDEDPIPTSSQS